MGMSTGGNKGGVQSEINVTPLIDVLLVLLIIFLVVMPIMIKKEPLTIPRKLDEINEKPDENQVFLSVKLQADQSIIWNDGRHPDEVIQAPELLNKLRDELKAIKPGTDKVVFVDFADGVHWADVVATMDSIRGLPDDVKIALTVCDDDKRDPSGCKRPQ